MECITIPRGSSRMYKIHTAWKCPYISAILHVKFLTWVLHAYFTFSLHADAFFRLYRECITFYNYCTCGNHARAVSIVHGIHTLWSLVEHNTGKDDRRKCVSIFPTAKKEDEKVQHEEVENVRNGFISSFRILLPQGKQWKYQCRKVIVVIPA